MTKYFQIILIDGTAENSSKAVVKILEVIEAEKEKERDRELAGGDSGLGDLEKSYVTLSMHSSIPIHPSVCSLCDES